MNDKRGRREGASLLSSLVSVQYNIQSKRTGFNTWLVGGGGGWDCILVAVVSQHPSVFPERGRLQVVGVGLQHSGVVSAQVLPVGGVADGQLVVVAELEEEVDGDVAAAHHRLLVTDRPVLPSRI